MKIRQWLLPESDTRNFGKMQGKYQYITIHNTANRMPAQADADKLNGSSNKPSKLTFVVKP